MSFLFGKRLTPEQKLRQQKRTLSKAIRELDRERQRLQRNEKKIQTEMKKLAKAGQKNACAIMARDLIRTRQHVDKFYKLKATLEAISLKVQTMKSNVTLGKSMKGVTQAMSTLNSQLNLPALQRIMMEFEKQSEVFDMKEEMMTSTIDDALDESEADEEAEEAINKVYTELNLEFESNTAVPSTPVATATSTSTAETPQTDALEDRLAALKR